MRKGSGIVLLCMICGSSASGQWRKVWEFKTPDSVASQFSYVRISALYFMEGNPLVGFVGLTSKSEADTSAYIGAQIWRTSDGGSSWQQVGPKNDRAFFSGSGVYDFVFKDSLTGWAAIYLSNPGTVGCYKTEDGGLTWRRLITGDDGYSLCYHNATERLYLSLAGNKYSEVSSDEGLSWQSLNTYFNGATFSDDLTGILSAGGDGQSNYPLRFTSDGGTSWHVTTDSVMTVRPIGIAGTKSFFMIGDRGVVSRSTNGGRDWVAISSLPDSSYFHSYELFGDSARLYTQSITGVYTSEDEGLNWHSLCGPANYMGGLGNRIGLWESDGTIFASEVSYPNQPARLWVNSTGDPLGPRLSLTSPQSTHQIGTPAGGVATVVVKTPITFLTGFVADSVSMTVAFDSDMLTPEMDSAPPGWTVRTLSQKAGAIKLKFVKAASTSIHTDSTLGWIKFRTNLAARTSSAISLGEINWDADSAYFDCVAASLGASDSVQVNVILGCGDTTIVEMLRGDRASFDQVSINPNPASSQLHILLQKHIEAPISAQIFDALGVVMLQGVMDETNSNLDVSALPSGVYYLRLRQSGIVQTRKVVIER